MMQSTKNNTMGRSLLLAVQANQLEAIRTLLVNGAAATQCFQPDNDTCLHLAVKNQHREIIRLLCQYYPELLSQQNDLGLTPMLMAARTKQWQLLPILMIKSNSTSLEHSRINETLWEAYQAQKIDIMEMLLSYGASPNISDEDNTPLLHNAIKNNDLVIIALLLKYGVTINNGCSLNAIDYAAELAHWSCLEVLTGFSIKKNTWFQAIAANRKSEVIALLSEDIGLDRQQDEQGNNWLHWTVADEKNSDLYTLLSAQKAHADFLQKNNDGNTPLTIIQAALKVKGFDTTCLTGRFDSDGWLYFTKNGWVHQKEIDKEERRVKFLVTLKQRQQDATTQQTAHFPPALLTALSDSAIPMAQAIVIDQSHRSHAQVTVSAPPVERTTATISWANAYAISASGQNNVLVQQATIPSLNNR